MKLISWNVNGIRAILGKGFLDYLDQENPDIICLQETKARREQVEQDFPQFKEHFWTHAEKKGYSGTAIFTKHVPISVSYGLGIQEHDNEGRVITLEFKDYYLVNVYTPNAKEGLARLPYRMTWDCAFLIHLKKLETKKPVIFCGDLNVAHQEIDLANPKSNVGNAGFTPEERAGFSSYLAHGFIDSFRALHPEKGHYTWWSYRMLARARNVGWRIDYFCFSASLRERLLKAYIRPEVIGSDHCPVGLELIS